MLPVQSRAINIEFSCAASAPLPPCLEHHNLGRERTTSVSSHWPHTVAHCCLHLLKTVTEDICTAVLWMFDDVTVGRSAVYSLWFQLISWHLAQAQQTSMFETMQSKLKWPPRFLWCTTSQQATDNAVIYSKPILESQRRFGCPVPAISLTGITFLQLKGTPGP